MKTNFEEYICHQMQDMEGKVQIDEWDDFQQRYLRHRRVRKMRIFIPLVFPALLALLLFGRYDRNADMSCEHANQACLHNDYTSEIRITVPECRDEITAKIRSNPVAVNDSCIENNQQQRMQSDLMRSSDDDDLSNSSTEKKDTISDIDRNSASNNNYFSFSNNHFKNSKPVVSIGLSGGPGMTNRDGSLVQMGNSADGKLSGIREEVKYSHLPPISFGISVDVKVDKRLTLVSGLDYSLYLTRKEIKSSYYGRYESQQLHYLGVPLRCNYSVITSKSFEWYVGGGFEFEKCIYAKSGSTLLKEQNLLVSATLVTGINYNIARHISLFCEPYCYYLLSETAIPSYRSDNPFLISARMGLRFNLQ